MIKVAKLTAAWGIAAAGLLGGLGVTIGMDTAVANADTCVAGQYSTAPGHVEPVSICNPKPPTPKNYVDDNGTAVFMNTTDWGSILGHTH